MVVAAVEEEEGAAKKQLHHKKEEDGIGVEFVSRVAVMASCDHDVTSGEGAQ